MSGKVLAKWAAVAAMACAGVAMAGSNDLSLAPDLRIPRSSADAAAPRKPLMGLLDKLGIAKTLDEANINVYGYAEASTTYSISGPPANPAHSGHHELTGRAFDFEHEDPVINQVDLAVERTVDVTKKTWDIGGRVEFIYGADSRLIHSNGLNFYGPNSAGGSSKARPGDRAKPGKSIRSGTGVP